MLDIVKIKFAGAYAKNMSVVLENLGKGSGATMSATDFMTNRQKFDGQKGWGLDIAVP